MEKWTRALADLRQRRRPSARVLRAPARSARHLAVVSGAFHPPTLAHRALARAALGAGADAALFALGTVTLDKDETGLALEERIALLDELAAGDDRLGIVVHNAGLYADQAVALRRAIPHVDELVFVVGMDKLPQLLDPRYYADIERDLARLFRLARLWVAPRGDAGYREFLALLSRTVVKRHRHRISWLPLARRWRAISATDVRAALARGDDDVDALPRGWAARLAPNQGRRTRRRRS
jgi:nicotinamide-nucleotide adenylyltransferase